MTSNKRILTGISGLDDLIDGGFRTHTINVVLAESGCGKSTFAWQYCSRDHPSWFGRVFHSQ